MLLYHGTTRRSAEQIAIEGFAPRKPSRRVWFAQSKGYALRRAKVKARRRHDRPVVLLCELDLAALRRKLGSKRVVYRAGIVSINGSLPVTVLRHAPGVWDPPSSEPELAAWLNNVLGLKAYRGIGRGDPGLVRLARWIRNRRMSQPRSRLRDAEILERATGWLPEWFRNVSIDPATLRVHRHAAELTVLPDLEETGNTEDLAGDVEDALVSGNARRRLRGLKRLRRAGDPDLVDWCALMLGDADRTVRRTALELIARSEEGDPHLLVPYARCSHKGLRAAAVAGLVHLGGGDSADWCVRGLRDPDDVVRLSTARELARFDPRQHRRLFELALYDPNAQVAEIARKLSAHRGYHVLKPRWS
ncbi:MAG: HEAT repeat domain-containing protein [Spirochaetaceae bacterium]|nr:HEAT repeat domain-containing protein [Spirochaetaceae bacterium]